MRAIQYDSFAGAPRVVDLPDPGVPERGAVVRVLATGVCRSDWHAWQGHDDSVRLPHVPGHEFAGVVEAVGPGVSLFAVGQRVTAPFILSCGRCEQCRSGATQVCPHQRQPGFDLPGSYAEKVAVIEADHNLVALPEGMEMTVAAGLGCRFGTAYHAVRTQADVRPGEIVVIIGCGGVGLSAVQVAVAAGAQVHAVDVSPAAREAARGLGAVAAYSPDDAPGRVLEATSGAHVSIDALGSAATASAAILSLRPRGRHVQVGLLLGKDAAAPLPMGAVIGKELRILGSHGIAAGEYRQMLEDIAAGRLDPQRTLGTIIGLEDLPAAIEAMSSAATGPGMTVARID